MNYKTIKSEVLTSCFTGIKSVCVIPGQYNTPSICVVAKSCNLGTIHAYGDYTKGYMYYFISCNKFGIPPYGTVIPNDQYDKITVVTKQVFYENISMNEFIKVTFKKNINY